MIKFPQIGIVMELIQGVSLGMEYMPATEDLDKTIIVDLLVIRLLVQWR